MISTDSFDKIRAANGQLVKITMALFYYMRDTLPPVYGNGCFAMGEPYSHTSEGVPTFCWTGHVADQPYACYGTKAQAEAEFLRARMVG